MELSDRCADCSKEQLFSCFRLAIDACHSYQNLAVAAAVRNHELHRQLKHSNFAAKFYAVLALVFLMGGIAAAIIIKSSNDPAPAEQDSAAQPATCVVGATCTTAYSWCYSILGDPASGMLSCDPTSKRLVTACELGRYCGPDAGNGNGCFDGFQSYFCEPFKHTLVLYR